MPSDFHTARDSGGAPATSAPDPRAEEPGATPEPQADEAGSAPLAAEEGGQAPASVPAGEPEAPVAPAPFEDESEEPTVEPPGAEPAETEPPGAEPAEPQQRLESDLDELTAKAEKADEYLELAQRTRADFENYRKRAAREAAAAQERGVVKVVRELLPAVDNLDRALDAVAGSDGKPDDDDIVSGIKLVHAEVVAALARAGVERFSPQGEPFDPERHEAVAQQPVEGIEAGTVAEVYQRGYRLGDSVIRPARVLVAG